MKDSLTVADDLLFKTFDAFKLLDDAKVTDQERTRYELKIYKSYFSTLARLVENPHSDGKTQTAREYVGRHIHPGYMLMPQAIFLFTNHAVLLPREERGDYLSPVENLMLLIGVRWHDAELAALNVQARIDEIMSVDIDTTKKVSQAVADQLMADFKRHEEALRDCLKALSETLLNAPAARADEMLAAINAVGEKVDAVGAVVKHTADNTDAIRADLDGWRDWLIAHKIVNAPNGSAGKRGKRPTDFVPELGFVNVRNEINQVWNDYTKGVADCELPGRLGKRGMRRFGQKRTYAECIAEHGDDKIWNGRTLRELLTVPAECGKTPEQVFEGVVHSAKETERQTRAKSKVRRKHSASAPQKRRRK